MTDTSTPLLFANAVEAMYFRALKGRVTPQLMDRIAALGIDLRRPLLPAYPFRTWTDTLEATAASIFPQLSAERAFYEMGKLLVTSYEETMLGGALFIALRAFSARRTINRMARNFRTSNNYTEVTTTEVGPTSVDLKFNLVEPFPSFTQGILAAGLPAAGLKGVTVTVVAHVGDSATYRIEWKEGSAA